MRKLLLVGMLLVSCGSPPPARTPEQRTDDSAPALKSLQAAQFIAARSDADRALTLDPRNSRAAAIRAIARYQDAGSTLFKDLRLLLEGGDVTKAIDHEEGRNMWQHFADALAAVDGDLAIAAADPGFSLELCLACWDHDWNQNGRVDEGDKKLFEIEYAPHASCAPAAPVPMDDANGTAPQVSPSGPPPEPECTDELPDNDPRRRPTFRFDQGDADWARAMVAFQRAAVEIILAYRWNELDKLWGHFLSKSPPTVVIRVADAKRVEHARELIRLGLEYSARSRTEYLAETDDDREWLPNPKQKNHPIPLPMDAAIYDTWNGVVTDLANLIDSKEGLSLRKIASAIDGKAALMVPDAWLDLGAMLRDPQQITLDFGLIDKLDDDHDPASSRPRVEQLLKNVLGNGYRTSAMRESPMLERIEGMRRSMEHDPNETFERKLHYLLWIN